MLADTAKTENEAGDLYATISLFRSHSLKFLVNSARSPMESWKTAATGLGGRHPSSSDLRNSKTILRFRRSKRLLIDVGKGTLLNATGFVSQA